jgi:hypothetical protein
LKKTFAIVLIALAAAAGAHAQGHVLFNNLFSAYGINAPITDACGVELEGDGYQAQLWYAHLDSEDFNPVGAAVGFRTGMFAGYVNVRSQGVRVLPDFLPGAMAQVQIRAWYAPEAQTWDTATTRATSPSLTLAVGGYLDPTWEVPSIAVLTGLQSFSLPVCIPEPTTVYLLGLCAGVLLLRFRRESKRSSGKYSNR